MAGLFFVSKKPHTVSISVVPRRGWAYSDYPGSHDKERIMTTAVQAIPPDMHSITPHLVCEGAAAAMEFYKQAFNAVETARLADPSGKLMHGSMRIGDSTIMLVDDYPDHGSLGPRALKGSPVTLHLYVEDVDAAYAQAVAAGGVAKMPPQDMFWGDRYGMLVDPFGHNWALATHIQDLTPEEITRAMAQQGPGGCGDPAST
jgi:PhnB protein